VYKNLRRTVCECRLRKLLNCNRYASVEKTCRVINDLHICYTRAICRLSVIDIKKYKKHVSTEWE